ncbi:putative C2H2 finger domain protein [Talaromyces proteolyticus]|uniref:C2H2 finger domain protein n=1 Tax=Talaromyces proteolyticus TaxID=1131652 RepID=A0AAD4KHI4_9EURO|nr:putative C2H2 finger domain protein [Talaromyces proteolyticus]KAH8691891.1 putative C2H2 finger domain protein [Talaromyces proteolyticus]
MARNRHRCRTTDLVDTESDVDSQFDTSYTDGSDTDLTEPEIQNHARTLPLKPVHATEKPPDDTDEDLSDIESDHDQPDGTKRLRTRVVERWQRYCLVKAAEEPAGSIWDDPEDALRNASQSIMFRFLKWTLSLTRGRKNRKLKGISTAGSFKTDWKNFRIYYQKLKGEKIDAEIARRIRIGIRKVIRDRKMNTQPRDNIPLYIEDVIPFNETIITTRKKRFHLGIQRIMLCLLLMLGLFTANRKRAMMRLQYKHILITMQRNPHGGPPVPSIDIKPEYVKQLLGTKDLNEFCFPEIIFGVSLVLSPHVFLFGLLFHANAFEPNVRSMEALRSLFISRGRQQLEVPIKREMDDYYIFCKVDTVNGKPRIFREQPMSDSSYYSAVKGISEIMGFLNCIFYHQFRYGTGEILDSTGWVSDSQRNLIMNHASTATFLEYYRPRRHANMQEAVLGLTPDETWKRALTSASRWKDWGRPRYLDDDAKALVDQDPELLDAIRHWNELEEAYERDLDPELIPALNEAQREVTNARQRARYKQKNDMRRGFSRKNAIIEINGQLSGSILPEDDISHPPLEADDVPPEMALLAEALLSVPVEWTLEGEWQRRNTASDVIVGYCDYEEGGPLRGRPKRKRSANHVDGTRNNHPGVTEPVFKASFNEEERLREQRKYKQKEEEVWTCFQCGKKYTKKSSLLRHFRPAHLNDRRCNSCNDGWEHLEQMHWQRHIDEVHHLRT